MEPPWIAALDDTLPYVDLLFCDETEARKITDQQDLDRAAQTLLDTGIDTLIVKQGAAGSTLYHRERRHHQEAVVLGELVDSIGAGDAFDAGVLYGWLHDWPWEQCLLFASVAAGFTVTGIGGAQTLPDLATILAETRKRAEW
jgi:sugar/nucleoside kinase (ribokinase family)